MSGFAPPTYAVKPKHHTGHSSLLPEKTFALPKVFVSTRGLAAGAAAAAPTCPTAAAVAAAASAATALC
eukprot:6051413-Amphidinium_carterae.1